MRRGPGSFSTVCWIAAIIGLALHGGGGPDAPSPSPLDAGGRGGRVGSSLVAAQTMNCTQTPLYTGNRTVNIAMLFWGPPVDDARFNDGNGSMRIRWPRNPMLEGWDGPSFVMVRFMRAYVLWEERMELPAAYGGGPGLILLDGSVMRFNISWFNLGEHRALRGPGEFTPQYQNSWANTLIKQLADAHGPYGRQHFILSPLISNSQVTILASLACEASGTCMMVSPGAAESRQFICQDPMPQDCLQRGRRKGSRRFENTVSAYSNADYWASGSMSLVVNQGFKRIFAIGESWSVNAMIQMSATAKLLGMQVVGSMSIASLTKDWRDYNTSSAEITQRIKDLGVDMVVVLHTFEDTTVLVQLVYYWREINFLPGAVAYLTGGAGYMPADFAAFFLIEVQWLSTLTGAQYRAVSTETNFETFPSNATHDSPAVFADAFTERWGYRPSDNVFFDSARTFHAVTIVQKLLELAQTEDTESLKQAAARIATPGVYHAVQFDQWGRSLPFDNYVMQLMPDGNARVLTPLGLGTTPILPIPGWSEREYNPVFLEKAADRVMFSLTVLTVVYLLCWLGWLALRRHHPLIRVADPLANALSLCGLIVLASACFFSTFLQSDATCAAFEWLLILGLTLGFAPLVLKNLRIWSLWHNAASFTPAPIRQWHTVCALCALLLIDVALLTAWHASSGLRAYRMSPDPWRPSLDYYSCDVYAHSRGFAIGAMSWKLLMLAAAMYLAYLLRNVSSKYSESRFIALCVYNVTVTLAIFVPVSATNTAGHEGTYLVRNYLLLFLCVSTASIMFVPKFLAIRRNVPKRKRVSFRKDETQAEPVSVSPRQPQPSPHDPRQPFPLLPPQGSPPPPHQWPATEPGNVLYSAVHSAHFPVSAPAPAPANQRVVDLRTPEWPPAQLPPFQSMIGLSQIEQRYAEDDSELGQSHDQRSNQSTRLPGRVQQPQPQRRTVGVEMSSYPAAPLEAVPHSVSSDHSSASLLRATLDLLSELPSDELYELRSTLLRRRQQPPPPDATVHFPSPAQPPPRVLAQPANSASAYASFSPARPLPTAIRLPALPSAHSLASLTVQTPLSASVTLHNSMSTGSSGSATTSALGSSSAAMSHGSESAASTGAMGSQAAESLSLPAPRGLRSSAGLSTAELHLRDAFRAAVAADDHEPEFGIVSFYEE